MNQNANRIILITGASTGIGKTSAGWLAARGYTVWAGVRQATDMDALRTLGHPTLLPVLLDVTREDHIADVAHGLAQQPQGLFAAINNAGFNYNSPFEFADMQQARALMEVNFFAVARLSQALIPSLRRGAELSRTTSKLINVSSIGGSLGVPWEAFYHASKFAVVGITESIRNEVWSQGIRAVVLQPGGIKTEFMPKTNASIDRALSTLPPDGTARYAQAMEVLRSRIQLSAKVGSPPESVAKALARIVGQRNPSFRSFVGLDARLMHALHTLLPFGWTHAGMRAAFGGG